MKIFTVNVLLLVDGGEDFVRLGSFINKDFDKIRDSIDPKFKPHLFDALYYGQKRVVFGNTTYYIICDSVNI